MFFHTHLFQEKDNTLWCRCGKIKTLPCGHVWKTLKETAFRNAYNALQTQAILTCEKCGEIKSINLTTGEIE